MTSQEVLAVYESIAALSDEMLAAARANDWSTLSALENQCAQYARTVESGPTTPLMGGERLRKIALLNKILATDRAITEITEPWMAKLANMSQASKATQSTNSIAVAQHH